MSRITPPPTAVHHLLFDGSDVQWDVPVLGVDAYHVKSECKAEIQREIEGGGLLGSWLVAKGVPPRPAVMPTDPVKVKMIEEGEARAEARLKMPMPDIWVSILTDSLRNKPEDPTSALERYVSKIEGGRYENFLSG